MDRQELLDQPTALLARGTAVRSHGTSNPVSAIGSTHDIARVVVWALPCVCLHSTLVEFENKGRGTTALGCHRRRADFIAAPTRYSCFSPTYRTFVRLTLRQQQEHCASNAKGTLYTVPECHAPCQAIFVCLCGQLIDFGAIFDDDPTKSCIYRLCCIDVGRYTIITGPCVCFTCLLGES